MPTMEGSEMKMPVKFRRSSFLTKLLVLMVVDSSVVLLVSQRSQIRENEAKTRALEDQAAQLVEENQNLREDIEGLGTDDSIKKIAREKLGLVESGEVIFSDIGD